MTNRYLYSKNVKNFINDKNTIHLILRDEYKKQHKQLPKDGEFKSWKKSLPLLADYLDDNDLYHHEILFEFMPPSSGSKRRVDAILLGKNRDKDISLVIENKIWPEKGISDCPLPEMLIVGTDEKIHPSIQANNYANELLNYHGAITTNNKSNVYSCSFLPKTNDKNHYALNDSKFSNILKNVPIFTENSEKDFNSYIKSIMPEAPTKKFKKSFKDAEYLPSKSLLLIAQDIFNEDASFTLSDNQLEAYNQVVKVFKSNNTNKTVIVIEGGPGTGKSLIGLKLLGYFSINHGVKINYSTGNSSFQTNIAGSLAKAAKDKNLKNTLDFEGMFSNFRSFYDKDDNFFDLSICDEAQRLQPSSDTQYSKVQIKQEQVLEVIKASKVSVFLIDENQRVRNNDIGSVERIKETSKYLNTDFYRYNLVEQFRCSGSEDYIATVNNIFELVGYEQYTGTSTKYDFKRFTDPKVMENALFEKLNNNYNARMIAGYCWKWTKTKKISDRLTNDVTIGDWQRPWNRIDTGGKSFNRANYNWANNNDCFNQIGCIHTSHGIEFDYVGVIMGGDLIRRNNKWVCDNKKIFDSGFKSGISKNPKRMTELLKNIYRVLFTRAKIGCFLYCEDKETGDYIDHIIKKFKKNI